MGSAVRIRASALSRDTQISVCKRNAVDFVT
jgi:hypothetical protein